MKSLIIYHDYLLYFSINNHKQPANLWKLYDKNRAHVNENAVWNYPNSEGDPLKAMLNEGAVMRQRTMGKIRRNNATDSMHFLRFDSFIPRSVRLFNRTPYDLQLAPSDKKQWADFKLGLKRYCMEHGTGTRIELTPWRV